jgi:hypothetical protein
MKHVLALSVLSVLTQAAPLDDLYKFKKDTTWTYKRLENETERKIVAKALGEEGGFQRIDWQEFEKDGKLHKSSVISWSVAEGVLTAAAKSQDEEITFGVIKEGSKKGDKWQTALGEMIHEGTVEITVPAGTYKDALKTRLDFGDQGRIDFFLAPKVGLIKIAVVEGAKESQLWELTEFKAAK